LMLLNAKACRLEAEARRLDVTHGYVDDLQHKAQHKYGLMQPSICARRLLNTGCHCSRYCLSLLL
jgi:hypothetical protein